MKKAIVVLLTVALMVTTVAAVGGGKSVTAVPEKIVIGTQSVVMDQTLAIAKGYIEEAYDGIDVEIINFDNGIDAVHAMISGDVDFFYSCAIPLSVVLQPVWRARSSGSMTLSAWRNLSLSEKALESRR